MEKIDKIIEILILYKEDNVKNTESLSRYNKLHEYYQKLIPFLKEDIRKVEDHDYEICALINAIYRNKLSDDFRFLLGNLNASNYREYEQLIKRIELDDKENRRRIFFGIKKNYQNKHLVLTSERCIPLLKANVPLFVKEDTKYDVKNIRRIISWAYHQKIIDEKEEAILVNEINYYNNNLLAKEKASEKDRAFLKAKYEAVPNIMQMGFQLQDVIKVNNAKKEQLDTLANNLYKQIINTPLESLNDIYDSYFQKQLSPNEDNYLMVNILNKMLDELLINYELLKDEENIFYIKNAIILINDYELLLDKYLSLRKYYEKINTLEENEEVKEEVKLDYVKKVIYVLPSNFDVNNAPILKDIKDIPEEYYENIASLIEGFKLNNIAPKKIKILNFHQKNNFFEIKQDQIRIIIKHLQNDIYVIMGITIKKEVTGRRLYTEILTRLVPDITNETEAKITFDYAKQIDDALNNYLLENKRKGTR